VDGTRDPALLAWLRERARLSQEERGTALTALAHAGDPADAALFVEGLASDDLGTPRACSDVLRGLAPPSDPATWSRVHALARATGHPRGWSALRVLAAWRGEALAPADPASFAEALLRAHANLRRRFPDLVIATESTPRPARDADAIATFLARSDARPASAAAGREVFVRATCASCHTIGGSALVPALTPGASGPDLSGVSKRLKPRELFAAVARPSAEVPDRWRSTVVETRGGSLLEGRVTREDARGLEITTTDGRATWIDAGDVAARRASLVSAMPEGLLATITLEEVRDLFAFLRADGRVEGPEPGWRPLFGARVDAGWTGDFDLFALEDGVLVGRARDLSTPRYLLSDLVASDFELEFDVRLTRGTNSGVQYRSRVEPGNPEPVGYQADLGQIYWGALYASDGRGLIHEPDPRLWRSVVDVDGWNHVFVRVAGDRHVI
jgi:putative heme-binding domain-containing protein